MSVLDNEWKLPRPSTAGRRLRVSDVTRVLSVPHCLLLIPRRPFFFYLDLCVCVCGCGGVCICADGFLFFLTVSIVGIIVRSL